jgi:hypothetical protein
MTVDVKQCRTILFGMDDMAVPKPVIERLQHIQQALQRGRRMRIIA